MNHATKWKVLCAVLFLIIVGLLVHEIVFQPELEKYPLLEPSLSSQTIDEFSERQASVRTSYSFLRPELMAIVNATNSTYGIYFEDLASGANVGVNERLLFTPRSLFKVTTGASVLKSIEEGELGFTSEVRLTEAMLDNDYGDLYKQGAGYSTTIEDLLLLSMAESDNTANNALRTTVPFERIEQARLAMGIPYPQGNITVYELSPKSYAVVFRSLYHSSYLRRPYSQYALDILTKSPHRNLIVAGVPEGVPVAHKIGEDLNTGEYHDCGIIYHPQRPYILCVMSKYSTQMEAEMMIPLISRTVYEQVDMPAAWRMQEDK